MGELKANYQLVIGSEKKILLDDETAPRPPYLRIIQNENGEQILTFVNPYNNAIYFYDYEKSAYSGRIIYAREGPNGILHAEGYYIKNMDSIYVYDRPRMEVSLTDSSGFVKQRISLNNRSVDRMWGYYYPQYFVSAVNPLIEYQGKMIMTGCAPSSVADSLIRKFRFTCCIDFKNGSTEFIHTYPEELYGSNFNWKDIFLTGVFREISPNGEWLYSFPVSHDIYITHPNDATYKTVYAGSNVAGTIQSIDWKGRTPNDIIHTHILQQDLYGAILYDSYRNVYYRFMLQGIPHATLENRISDKLVVVVLMDEQFNYLGETILGTGEEWNCENSFVTSEGLMIEYIDLSMNSEEEYLIFKTLLIEKK